MSSTKPNIDPWPDLPTAERDFRFGQLWVLGSQYADLLEAARIETKALRHDMERGMANHNADLNAGQGGDLNVTKFPGGGIVSNDVLAEDFGDPVTLLNSREWLENAVEAKGARVTGGGCGGGQADIDIVLEGCKFNLSIRPRFS